MRAYKAYKNQKYYYKCNTSGCKCNKRADDLHDAVKVILEEYTVDINEDYRKLIKAQTIVTYNQLNKDKEDLKATLEKELSEVEKKIERLEERYVLEEIDSSMFQKFKAKFNAERVEISKHLAKNGKQVSNLEGCIDYAITMASKLAAQWDSSDYGDKQSLQNLVFPEGMTYNRKKDKCRTPRVNSIFSYIVGLASISDKNKNGNITLSSDVPAFVDSPDELSNRMMEFFRKIYPLRDVFNRN